MMGHLLTLATSLTAFAALALATERQQGEVLGRELSARANAALRTLGGGALTLALAISVQAQGWGLGLVSYSGHTSLAAGLVFGALIVGGRLRSRGGKRA